MKLALSINRLLVFMLYATSIFAYSQQFTDAHIVTKWIFVGIIICIIGLYNSVLVTNSNGYLKENILLLEAIIPLCLLQAVYGILQYWGLLSSHSLLEITGSFDNPAGFAACLCAGLPFIGFLLSNNSKYIRCTGWIVGIIIAMAIILSGSRAGIVSIAMAVVVFLFQRLNRRRYVWKYVLLVSTILLFIACYWAKKDSADGRLLIWQCSINMVKDAPLLGHGIGSFEACYMDYQAEYFKTHETNRYSMLADNVKHPFNEYICVLLNFGIVGLMILLIFVFFLVWCYGKKTDKEKRIAAYVLFAIGIFSLFSYPFMYPFTWIVTFICIYFIIKDQIKNLLVMSGVKDVICVIVFIGSFWGIYKLIDCIQTEKAWTEVSELSLAGKYKEVLPVYKVLEGKLTNDPYFLYNYAAILLAAKQYEESLKIALRCRRYWADYDLELIIGENYQRLKQPEHAALYYNSAALMCPSRFLPHYKLFFLYKENGENKRMIEVAETIIRKPIKIKTPAILMMKREMKKEKLQVMNKLMSIRDTDEEY